MKRLREADGTSTHRRAARYHESKCRQGKAALHGALADEMSSLRMALIGKARAAEDAEDDAVGAGAAVDGAEVHFENVIRDLDSELEKLDRKEATHGAQAAVFPEGFGAIIDPEGDAQLGVMPGLRVAVKPYQGHAGVTGVMDKLEAAADALKAALAEEAAAEAAAEAAFAEELAARAAIREQMESAYGRLRAHYKARPALAEGFFLKEGGRRRATKKEASGGGGPAAGTGAPA